MSKVLKLTEANQYNRYKVSFYVDTIDMTADDIKARTDEILKGSGLAATDETIEVVNELDEEVVKDNES